MLKVVSQLTTTKISIREAQLFLDLFIRKISSSKAGRDFLLVFAFERGGDGGVFAAVFILLFFPETTFARPAIFCVASHFYNLNSYLLPLWGSKVKPVRKSNVLFEERGYMNRQTPLKNTSSIAWPSLFKQRVVHYFFTSRMFFVQNTLTDRKSVV